MLTLDATVVAHIEAHGAGPVTRLRVKGLPTNAACLRFIDVPGDSLKLGQTVRMTIEAIEKADLVRESVVLDPVLDSARELG